MHTRLYVRIILRRIRRGMKNRARKAVSKAMKETAEGSLIELNWKLGYEILYKIE